MDQKQVILVIGLPGSGKTSYCLENYPTYTIFDDFLMEWMTGNIQELINNGENVCLNDPRLCIKSTFKRIINQLYEMIGKDDIHLVVFTNEPYYCAKNVAKRDDGRAVNHTIFGFSALYKLETYQEWQPEIKEVFKTN